MASGGREEKDEKAKGCSRKEGCMPSCLGGGGRKEPKDRVMRMTLYFLLSLSFALHLRPTANSKWFPRKDQLRKWNRTFVNTANGCRGEEINAKTNGRAGCYCNAMAAPVAKRVLLEVT